MNALKTILAIAVIVGIIIAVIIGLQFKNGESGEFLSASLSQISNLSDTHENSADNISESITHSNTTSLEKNMKQATFITNFGNFTLELDTENTPKTAENFIRLATDGFYNGTRFHRVIDNFMIQGGDPQSKDLEKRNLWGTGGPGYQFDDEIMPTNHNAIGTISMANAGPNTNGSQFFINVADNSYLDDKHTVFGKVISGMDVIEKIAQTQTNPMNDQPIDDIIINQIVIE